VRLIARLVEHGLNTPPTSSAGRLFDAVAALVGVPGSKRTTYEGQAAIELELAAKGPANRTYPFFLRPDAQTWVIETRGIIAAVVEDLLAGRSSAEIAAAFHQTMARIVAETCDKLRASDGVNAVALSGGTFQNMLLLTRTTRLLKENGFVVHTHQRVPANDGGLALGQAILADKLAESADRREARHVPGNTRQDSRDT
jgi:hydrogenase maturation protein HypF